MVTLSTARCIECRGERRDVQSVAWVHATQNIMGLYLTRVMHYTSRGGFSNFKIFLLCNELLFLFS